jgi:hypothetical protein
MSMDRSLTKYRDFYEKNGSMQEIVDECFNAVSKKIKAAGLKVDNADTAENFVSAIAKFIVLSNYQTVD